MLSLVKCDTVYYMAIHYYSKHLATLIVISLASERINFQAVLNTA